MKIQSRKTQNIKNPVLKAIEKKQIKEENKDTVEVMSKQSTEQTQTDTLKIMQNKLKKGAEKTSEYFDIGKESLLHGAEKTSEYLDKNPILNKTLDTSLQFFKTLKAFPRFIYPSLIGMTGEEREMVTSILDELPMKHVGAVKSITMVENLPGGSGAAGPVPFSPFVLLSRDSVGGCGKWAQEVVTHEIGHTVDYNTGLFGLPKLFSESSKAPWGKGPFISSYAETGPGWYPAEWDDFAESFAYYYRQPDKLKETCPEKFNRLQEMEKKRFF